MRRRWLVLALATTLLACGAPPERGELPGDPRLLEGTWELALRRGAWTRLMPVGGEITHGQLVLRPFSGDSIPADGRRMVPCTSCLRGSFHLEETDWFPESPRGDRALAFVFQDGSATILLQVAGSCSDCGNLMLTGRVQGHRVKGAWEQEFLGRGLSGAFVLRRISKRTDTDRGMGGPVDASLDPAARARTAAR